MAATTPSRPDTPPLSSLPTAFPSETCIRRGLCPVTSLRKQGSEALEGHSLYYEQHGPPDATTRIVFIMGLNSSSFSWGPQVRFFGKGGEGGDCTALVFDNRGVGNSGYPRGPYTTSGMAEDVICLLDYLGWTKERELNVVGISLGGMIAQELAYRIPQRIGSLVLAVTTPGGHFWNNMAPWKGVKSLATLLFTPDPLEKVPIVLEMLFPKSWLSQKADIDTHWEYNGNTIDNKQEKTNYEVQKEGFLFRVSITKPQLLLGHISQMCAALTHNVSPSRLAYVAANIPKIAIVTGDEDNLVRPTGSERIKAGMDLALCDEEDKERVELLNWKGTGHGIHAQREVTFNQLVERCAREGQKRLEQRWKPRDVPAS